MNTIRRENVKMHENRKVVGKDNDAIFKFFFDKISPAAVMGQ